MSNGPLPSTLTLLSNLPAYDFGDKVRFLGCVTSYSMASAELTLHHDFPKTPEVKAVVDVRLILEKLNAEQCTIGQWVNVIGYIAVRPAGPANGSLKLKAGASTVHVQAQMLWSAGPLDTERYGTCLAAATEAHESKPNRKSSKPV